MLYPVVEQAKVSESQVVNLWQYLLLKGTELTAEDGMPIKIIYPGRINDDQGADFRDAVMASNQGLVLGDIEIHFKSSDWQAHRHHRNPQYNRVILHVVMKHDRKTATGLENGRSIPTLVLDKYTENPIPPVYTRIASNTPCCRNSLTPDIVAEFLDNAGRERFLTKAAKFEASIAQIGAGQSLYQGLMGALGYYKNRLPFQELAHRLSLQFLESMAPGAISDEEYLARQQALILGTAGLLPSQGHNWHRDGRDDGWVDRLEKLWTSFHPIEVMPPNSWYLFRVRPSNSPVRRLIAMSHLVLRYREKGILEELLNIVREASLNKSHRRLEAALVIVTNGYQASHFDFSSGSRIENPSLLGRGRAADIVVNVLLPFTFAWGRLNSRPELVGKAFTLYHNYPKLSVNTVEQHMRRQAGLNNNLVNSAQRQQGLIHIYNTLCTQGKCGCCPLGNASKVEPQNVSEAQPSFNS
jgi:hypothetical protein